MRKLYSVVMVLIVLTAAFTYAQYDSNKINDEYISWEQQMKSAFSPKNPYEIYIDLSEYRLYLFKNSEIIKTYPVSGGKQHTPSPFGIWKIVHKAKWGKGFGGHWMGLNVPWGKYGIHGTSRPSSIGHSASHGCIRMYNHHAEELWKIVPHGTLVIISKSVHSPFGLYPRIIKPGDTGADVMHVQMILKKKGLYNQGVDGIYGDGMKSAVFELQKQNGISPHNEIDKQTLEAMGIFWFE